MTKSNNFIYMLQVANLDKEGRLCDERTWAAFTTKEKAVTAAKECALYAMLQCSIGIVEKVKLDAMAYTNEPVLWFLYKRKTKKVVSMKCPKYYKNVCAFTVG